MWEACLEIPVKAEVGPASDLTSPGRAGMHTSLPEERTMGKCRVLGISRSAEGPEHLSHSHCLMFSPTAKELQKRKPSLSGIALTLTWTEIIASP